MSKNTRITFGFLFAALLSTQAFSQETQPETQTVTFEDGESVIVSKKVLKALNNLDYQAQEAMGVSASADVSNEGATSREVGKKVVKQIANIVNYRSLLNEAIVDDLGSNRLAAAGTFLGAEGMQLALCTEFRGNDTGDCAMNAGFNLGRRYIRDLTVDRWVKGIDGWADKKYENKKGKANGFAKFILKNTDLVIKQAANLALNIGQNSLESALGSDRSTSFIQGAMLGTFDSAAYQALRSTRALPGAKNK